MEAKKLTFQKSTTSTNIRDTRRGLLRLNSLADSVCIQLIVAEWMIFEWFSPNLIEPRKFQITWLLEDRMVKPTLTENKCCKHTRYQKHHPQTSFSQLLWSYLRVIENPLYCFFLSERTCAKIRKRVFDESKILRQDWNNSERLAFTSIYLLLTKEVPLIEMIITWPVFFIFFRV